MPAYGEDMRHDLASAVAAEIVNLLASDCPGGNAELYGRVYLLIMRGLDEAEKCVSASRLRISDN